MAKFKQGDLVLTQTQKLIQGSDTVLNADSTAALNALSISGDPMITSITTDGDLTTNSDNKLATEKAIRTYVANHGGTSGTGGTGGYHIHTQTTPASTWNVTHDLGEQFVNVEVIGSDDKSIVPSEINFTDSTSLQIDFSYNITGYASVTIGGGSGVNGTSGTSGTSGSGGTVSSRYVHTQTSDSTAWTVVHDLGERYVVAQVYDDNDYYILPQDIHLDSTSQLTITFVENQKGSAVIIA